MNNWIIQTISGQLLPNFESLLVAALLWIEYFLSARCQIQIKLIIPIFKLGNWQFYFSGGHSQVNE